MSFLGELSKGTGYLGRGLEDLFTLGGMEAARNNGGNFGNKFFGVLDKGFGANFEAGAAGGSSILGAQGLGMGSGGSAMASYMPTSTPVMGQAGSTLGAGMSSPMNLGPSAMGSTGAADGMAVPGASAVPAWQQALQNMRQMPSGGSQQASAPQNVNHLAMIYKMFPSLRPGSQMGQGMRVGGFNG